MDRIAAHLDTFIVHIVVHAFDMLINLYSFNEKLIHKYL